MNIISLRSLEILDSRGNPTLQTYVTLDDGTIGMASVPSGASTGSHESVELRDNQQDHYQGKSVDTALYNIHATISHALVGMPIEHLDAIDERMISIDGTPDKSRLGANAVLSVSLACARAYALYKKLPLWKALNAYYFPHTPTSFPRLMVNVMNGGAHAHWVTDIQECMISPRERVPSSSIEMSANIFHSLKKILESCGYASSVGDEGGFAPDLATNGQAFEMIQKAIHDAGYTREQVDIATDIAGSELFAHGIYTLRKAHTSGSQHFDAPSMMQYLESLDNQFHIMSFEDPFAEDDWGAWHTYTTKHGHDHMIVGDDIYVTHPDRIQQGIDHMTSNAVLIKLNQIGTLYETVQAIKLAQKAGWSIIISHRSGETPDSFISDLAVASHADFIKAGSMSRSERLAKYNRLLEIEKIEY